MKRDLPRWFSSTMALCVTALISVMGRAQEGILPPPLPVVTVVASTPTASEAGPVSGAFTVGRTGETNHSLTVFYYLHGTAQNGVDYVALPGFVVIPAGQTRALIPVTPLPDLWWEPTESVELELLLPPTFVPNGLAPLGYGIGFPARAVVMIADATAGTTNHPPAISLLAPADGARFTAPATITLIAQAGDEDGSVTTVEFFAGPRRIGVVVVDPGIGATAVNEDVTDVNFVWPDVPAGEYMLTARATDNQGATWHSFPVRILVTAENLTPFVSVIATDPDAAERPIIGPLPLNGGLGLPIFLDTGTFTIRREGSTTEPLTVYYQLGGTADNGVDYVLLPEEITIPAGARSADVVVVPIADTLVEGPETVELLLTPPPFPALLDGLPGTFRAPYFIGQPAGARVTIADNDLEPATNHPPVVSLVSPTPNAVFIAPANILLLADARDFDGSVTTVEFFEGTNLLGVVTNNPLLLQPGRPVGPFLLEWTNVSRGEYTLLARATDNAGAVSVSPPVRIEVAGENIQPMVMVTATTPHAFEGPSNLPVGAKVGIVPPPEPARTATFTFRRTGGTNLPLTVYYSLSGTASNGVDYAQLPGVVTIPAGEWAAGVVVQPLDDTLVETTETVVLTLEPPVCIQVFPPPEGCYYLIGQNHRAVAYIHDNDFVVTNHPPEIRLINPPDGAVLVAASPLTLVAETHDPDGVVSRVEFFEGTNSLGVVTNQPFILAPVHPFSLVWREVAPGTHTLSARATDDRGASAESRPIHITVLATNSSPAVRIAAIDRYAVEQTTNNAVFRVFRSGATNAELLVPYAISGSASNGVDYAELPGVVTIPVGAAFADVTIIPINDGITEGIETVTLTLLPADGAAGTTLGADRYHGGPRLQATVWIFGRLPAPPPPLPPVAAGILRGGIMQSGWRLAQTRADRTSDAITVNGDTDELIVIEVANDLHEWSYLTHGFVVDGKLTFTDPDRAAVGTRFYRVVTP